MGYDFGASNPVNSCHSQPREFFGERLVVLVFGKWLQRRRNYFSLRVVSLKNQLSVAQIKDIICVKW